LGLNSFIEVFGWSFILEAAGDCFNVYTTVFKNEQFQLLGSYFLELKMVVLDC
jgi:hypothetical protein